MQYSPLHVYGSHARSNGDYPFKVEEQDIITQWDELVDTTGITTSDFELMPANLRASAISELRLYRDSNNDFHFFNAVEVVSPFVSDSSSEPVASSDSEELVGPPSEAAGNVPSDFIGLEAAWEQLEASGISAGIYEGFSDTVKSEINQFAQAYVLSNGADFGALQDMLTAANSAIMPIAEQLNLSAEDIVVAAFAQEFPMQDVRDHNIFRALEAVVEFEQEFGTEVTIDHVANGIKIFKFAGFPSYNPESLLKYVTLCVERSLGEEAVKGTIRNLVSMPEFCADPSRISYVTALFGDLASIKFEEFCSYSPEAKADELFLADYNIATLLGINEFGFDDVLLSQMGTQIQTENIADVAKEVAKEARQDAKSSQDTDSLVTKAAGTKSSKFKKDKPSKLVAFSALGITVIGLGLLFNKIRKH
jgi:hypothetical protein